jgi:hypothetical protein
MEYFKVPNKKPGKETNAELWALISEMIPHGNYIFLKHAHNRLKDRNVSDLDVLDRRY